MSTNKERRRPRRIDPVDNLAILVPLKSFEKAKGRLRDGGVSGVADLARSLAEQVLAAGQPRCVFVASESRDVTDFARQRGAEVIESKATNLNEAVSNSYQVLSRRFNRIIIAHGDLREPLGLGQFEPLPGITIITDSHRSGTNILALPGGLDFTFSFGPDSANAHHHEARRLGVEVRMNFDSPWRFDVDEPEDLL